MHRKWKIAFDARMAQHPGSGVASYSIGLIRALRRHEEAFDFCFVIEKGCSTQHITFPPNSEIYATSAKKESRWTRDIWEQTQLPRKLRQLGVHLYHGLDYTIPLTKTSFVKVVTFHDATVHTPFDGRPWLSKARIKFLQRHIASSADSIITISDYAQRQITKYTPAAEGKLSSVWISVDEIFRKTPVTVEDRKYLQDLGLNCEFILYYGGFRRNKQVDMLVQAFGEVSRLHRLKLVIAGNMGEASKALDETARASGCEHLIVKTGLCSNDKLVTLLNACTVFVFPSAMEGFGLPVVEAMACGTPVVCSDAASLPEIGGDSVEYFRSGSVENLVTAVKRVLSDEGLQERLRATGLRRARLFTWDSCVDRLAEIYLALLNRRFVRSDNATDVKE